MSFTEFKEAFDKKYSANSSFVINLYEKIISEKLFRKSSIPDLLTHVDDAIDDTAKNKIIEINLPCSIADIESAFSLELPAAKTKKEEIAQALINEGFNTLESISSLINKKNSILLTLYFSKSVFGWNKSKPIGDRKRYITTDNQTPYRHQVLSPLSIYHLIQYELESKIRADHIDLNELTNFLLSGEPSGHTDIVEQMASRAELFLSPGVLSCMVCLYWDWTNKKAKNINDSPGGLRSFVAPQGFYRRSAPTWYLQAMTGAEVWALLKADPEYTTFTSQCETYPRT